MTSVKCPCGVGIDAATLCGDCLHRLQVSLANINAYYADLDTLRMRRVRYSESSNIRGVERALGMDLRFEPAGRASEVDHDTRHTLTAWCKDLKRQHPNAQPGPVCRACRHDSCIQMRRSLWPSGTVTSMVRYLMGWSDRMRTHDDGPQMLDEMADLESRLRRLVDRPADRWYAGLCGGPCTSELYARTDRGTMTCRECGTIHDVEKRREWLLGEAENVLATASETARAVVVWSDYDRGETRLVRRIGTWAARGRIQVRGHVEELGKMRPTYRIGDVLDLLAADARHDAQRTASRV